MKGKIGKIIYIVLFAVLYLVVAGSSLWHAIEFFGLANGSFMALILAFAFEVGQAAVLFALLTSTENRGKVMPWVLMTMFTLVQVLGNVYSSYKHIILNSVENLRFFKEPIFIWTTIPDNQATVIITYLVGGLLPVSSLLLTSMMTSYLTSTEGSGQDVAQGNNLTSTQEEKSKEDTVEPAGNSTHEDTVEPAGESHQIETPQEEATETAGVSPADSPQEQMLTDAAPQPINEDKMKGTHMVSL